MGLHVVDTAQLEASFIADLSGSVGFQPFLNLSGELRRTLQSVGESIVADFEAKRAAAGVRGEGRMVEGLVVAELSRASGGADTLFLGLHGTGVRRGKSLGGHADTLVRRREIPVLLSPPDAEPLRRPVVAFDGSDRSLHALAAIARWCSALNVPLDVLTVAESPDEVSARRTQAERAMEGTGAAFRFESGSGHPEDVILARAPVNDLIAIGSHGHGRIAELVLGSTTERVLRRTTVSVLCVP